MNPDPMPMKVGNPDIKLPPEEYYRFIHWKETTMRGLIFNFFGLGCYALVIFVYTIVTLDIQTFGLWIFRAFSLLIFPIAGLLAFVFIIYGIGQMQKGKKGFGPIHFQKAYLGMIFFMLFFISFAAVIILQGLYSMWGLHPLREIDTLVFNSLLLANVVFLALCFVFLIMELSPRE